MGYVAGVSEVQAPILPDSTHNSPFSREGGNALPSPNPSTSFSEWSALSESLIATQNQHAPLTRDCIHFLPELEPGTLLVANPNTKSCELRHLQNAVVLVIGYDEGHGTIGINLTCLCHSELPVPPLELVSVPLRIGGDSPSEEVVGLYKTPEGVPDFPGTLVKGLSFIFGFSTILHGVNHGNVDKTHLRMYHFRQHWGRGELEAQVKQEAWSIVAVPSNYIFDLKPDEIYTFLVNALDLG